MKIETKTYKCITLSLSELGMLKAVEIERQKECDNCGCRIDSRTLRYNEERHKYLRLSVLKDAVNKWNTRVDDEPYKKLFDLTEENKDTKQNLEFLYNSCSNLVDNIDNDSSMSHKEKYLANLLVINMFRDMATHIIKDKNTEGLSNDTGRKDDN